MPLTESTHDRIEISDKLLQTENDIVGLFEKNSEARALYVGLVERAVRNISRGTRLFLSDLMIDLVYGADQHKSVDRHARGNESLLRELDDSLTQYMLKKHENFDLVQREYGSERQLTAMGTHSLEGVVCAIRAALKLKDDYTRRHLDNTAAFATAIARGIGLPESQVAQVRRIAHLHDIGKIGIDTQVLNKPGKLNAEEMRQMMLHETYGGNILTVLIPGDPETASMVRTHHAGYSDMRAVISDERLLLNHGMMRLADSHDAMMSDRPYRRTQPFDYSVSEFKRYAGTQFHPELVEEVVGRGILRPENVQRYAN